MAKVIEFPRKKELPDDIREQVAVAAKSYIGALNRALLTLCGDEPNEKQMEEVTNLVITAYGLELCKAIDEVEKDLSE